MKNGSSWRVSPESCLSVSLKALSSQPMAFLGDVMSSAILAVTQTLGGVERLGLGKWDWLGLGWGFVWVLGLGLVWLGLGLVWVGCLVGHFNF